MLFIVLVYQLNFETLALVDTVIRLRRQHRPKKTGSGRARPGRHISARAGSNVHISIRSRQFREPRPCAIDQ